MQRLRVTYFLGDLLQLFALCLQRFALSSALRQVIIASEDFSSHSLSDLGTGPFLSSSVLCAAYSMKGAWEVLTSLHHCIQIKFIPVICQSKGLTFALLSSRWCHCRNFARCSSSCLCRLLSSVRRFFVLVLPALPTLPALNRKLPWAPGCGTAARLTDTGPLTGKAAACSKASGPLVAIYRQVKVRGLTMSHGRMRKHTM